MPVNPYMQQQQYGMYGGGSAYGAAKTYGVNPMYGPGPVYTQQAYQPYQPAPVQAPSAYRSIGQRFGQGMKNAWNGIVNYAQQNPVKTAVGAAVGAAGMSTLAGVCPYAAGAMATGAMMYANSAMST